MSVTATERPASAAPADADAHTASADAEAWEPLRERAQTMAESLPKGYRVEVFGGSIVVSPCPGNRHNRIVRELMLQLEAALPDDRVAAQTTAVGLSGNASEYTIPDLVVMPASVEEKNQWLNEPDAVEFVLEVVSDSSVSMDLLVKPRVYAEMAIPIALIVDPREGWIYRHDDPRDGEYRSITRFLFGEDVPLTEPVATTLSTKRFLTYRA
ncbi:Uma2 family endonuclease [Nocardiopsis coralliicola]